MSTVNVAMQDVHKHAPIGILDDATIAGPASTQAGATPIRNRLTRCIVSAANGSYIMRSVLDLDAVNAIYYVVNDSANTIKVYADVGENMDGSLNSYRSIAAGATGVFVPIFGASGPDWRSNSIA